MGKETENFGEHLTIDGYGGNYKLLNDKYGVLKALDELPELLGMHKLVEPQISYCAGNDIKDPGGWSGVVMIAESHISIHTFPGNGFITADVYTCKNGMDIEFILNFFRTRFGLKEIEHNVIKRGKRYPMLVKNLQLQKKAA